nr:hypothetical protein [Dickeya fangzhongdai]
MIQSYMDAEKAVLEGKSITFNGQQMTMENLNLIIAGREKWERRLSKLQRAQNGRPAYKVARFL